MISQKIDQIVREVPDFPKSGINFKDITSLLLDSDLSTEIVDSFIERLEGKLLMLLLVLRVEVSCMVFY